ncbi:MAG: hypothetical protein IIU06_09015 [Erysipelotrichales bacterium]|nr:hypothetical protein [Erysipelotrichales bacterium]
MSTQRYAGFLDRFLGELSAWNQTGREPETADLDVRYDMDLREKRLKKLGLSVKEEYLPVKDEIRGTLSRNHEPYRTTIQYKETSHTASYQKDGKEIYRSKKPENVYVSVLDRDGNKDYPYVCPNCGNRTMASKLRDGCPYCGTRFETSRFYPKVNGYYTVPGIVERAGLMDRIKRMCLISGGAAGILAAGATWFGWEMEPFVFKILATLFTGAMIGGIIAFIVYMAYSLTLVGKVFYEGGRAVPLLSSMNSAKKMRKFMEPYDPEFSYELFEGKVISRLRAIAFSDKRDDLTIYAGNEDLSYFDNLADMRYRGALAIRECRAEKDRLIVSVRAYMTDLYYNKKIRARDEVLYADLEIGKDAAMDPAFSVHAVTCPSCGASFDAMHEKTCPHCGNEYKLIHEDWIVTSVRRG